MAKAKFNQKRHFRIRQQRLFEAQIQEAYERGRLAGVIEGKKQANAEWEVSTKKALYDTRMKLANSYAVVFEAVARSANMFFDAPGPLTDRI